MIITEGTFTLLYKINVVAGMLAEGVLYFLNYVKHKECPLVIMNLEIPSCLYV